MNFKYIAIIGLALIVSLLVWKVIIPMIKISKLAAAWLPYTQKIGLTFTKSDITKELKKLPPADVDTLIDFSKKLEAKDWANVLKMAGQIDVILKKTTLGSISTYMNALVK